MPSSPVPAKFIGHFNELKIKSLHRLVDIRKIDIIRHHVSAPGARAYLGVSSTRRTSSSLSTSTTRTGSSSVSARRCNLLNFGTRWVTVRPTGNICNTSSATYMTSMRHVKWIQLILEHGPTVGQRRTDPGTLRYKKIPTTVEFSPS